jgi:hypothetical protein
MDAVRLAMFPDPAMLVPINEPQLPLASLFDSLVASAVAEEASSPTTEAEPPAGPSSLPAFVADSQPVQHSHTGGLELFQDRAPPDPIGDRAIGPDLRDVPQVGAAPQAAPPIVLSSSESEPDKPKAPDIAEAPTSAVPATASTPVRGQFQSVEQSLLEYKSEQHVSRSATSITISPAEDQAGLRGLSLIAIASRPGVPAVERPPDVSQVKSTQPRTFGFGDLIAAQDGGSMNVHPEQSRNQASSSLAPDRRPAPASSALERSPVPPPPPNVGPMDHAGRAWSDRELTSNAIRIAQPTKSKAPSATAADAGDAEKGKPASVPPPSAEISTFPAPRSVDSVQAGLRSLDHPTPSPQPPGSSSHSALETASASPPNSPAPTGGHSSFERPIKLALTAQASQAAHMEQLALHIAARSARGDSRFTIRLDPPELGRIEVNLNLTSHGHAQAALAVDKPQTLELLQRDASTLERTLKEAGVDLGGNLSFSLKGEGRSPFAHEDYSPPRGRLLEIVAADKVTAHSASSSAGLDQSYDVPHARLDIRV